MEAEVLAAEAVEEVEEDLLQNKKKEKTITNCLEFQEMQMMLLLRKNSRN